MRGRGVLSGARGMTSQGGGGTPGHDVTRGGGMSGMFD